jgi:phosphate transport system substrate-binding protein
MMPMRPTKSMTMLRNLPASATVLIGVVALIPCLLWGCSERKGDTPTKGHAAVAVSEEVLPLVREEEARFEELYPEAKVDLRPRTAREAIAELFNDSVKVIVSTRELNAEELAAQKSLNLEITDFTVALDALVVIVNPANDVTKLTLPQLDSVFSGAVMDWGLLGWKGAPGRIALCVPDRNMSANEMFSGRVLRGGGFSRGAKVIASSLEMIAAVTQDPSAIGIVGLNWMRDSGAGVRALDLADPAAPDSLQGGKYWSPHQAYVYQRFYPLVRSVHIFITPDSYGVSSGFTSFMTSAAGQKVVQSQGLVPATMPVRLVELRNDAL